MWIVSRPGHRCSFYKRFKTSWSRHIGHVPCVWWGTFPVPVSPPSPIKFLYPYKTQRLSMLVSSVQKPGDLCLTVVSCCTLGQTVHNTWLKTHSQKLFGAPELRQSQSRPAIFLTELVEEQKDAGFLKPRGIVGAFLQNLQMCNVAFVYAGSKAKKSLSRRAVRKEKRLMDESAPEQTSTIKKLRLATLKGVIFRLCPRLWVESQGWKGWRPSLQRNYIPVFFT